MPIDRLDFDNLAEKDLTELLDVQVPEGLRIEYKRDPYGRTDADKREFLKDVSAFANAYGGHLIIGIEERDSIPIAIPGVSDVNQDDEILRMEQLSRTGIEPSIQGIRTCAVSLANGANCFVLRIPRSWYPPHRVSAQKSNRFWVRNSRGAHEASVEELRTMFTLGADAFDRVLQLRSQRLKEIVSGSTGHRLQGNGRLILHVVPLASVTSKFQVDLRKAYDSRDMFHPMNSNGRTPRFNFDGLIIEHAGDRTYGYTQIFRNGMLEATEGGVVVGDPGDSDRRISSLALEKGIFDVLPMYLSGLQNLIVPPPVAVLLTLEGVKDVRYAIPQRRYDGRDVFRFDRDVLFLPECLINEYGTDLDYHRAMRPTIDALWNSIGQASSEYFSDDGIWMGDPSR